MPRPKKHQILKFDSFLCTFYCFSENGTIFGKHLIVLARTGLATAGETYKTQPKASGYFQI